VIGRQTRRSVGPGTRRRHRTDTYTDTDTDTYRCTRTRTRTRQNVYRTWCVGIEMRPTVSNTTVASTSGRPDSNRWCPLYATTRNGMPVCPTAPSPVEGPHVRSAGPTNTPRGNRTHTDQLGPTVRTDYLLSVLCDCSVCLDAGRKITVVTSNILFVLVVQRIVSLWDHNERPASTASCHGSIVIVLAWRHFE